MKFYNLGHKTFETDFNSLLILKCELLFQMTWAIIPLYVYTDNWFYSKNFN